MRLLAWSSFCFLVGLAAWPFLGTTESSRNFLTWTVGWCAVNLIIVAASWKGKPPEALSKLREFLMLNQGLNVGYIFTGLFVGLLGKSEAVQAGAWAVMIQGIALLVLDSLLLAKLNSSSK